MLQRLKRYLTGDAFRDGSRDSSKLRSDGGEQTGRLRGSSELRSDGGTAVESESRLPSLDSEFVRSLPFWLPPFLLMGLFVYGAIGWNFVLSLTDFSGLSLPTYAISQFDFETYAKAFSDPTFWIAARNTVILLVVFTGFCLVIGLLLAILVDQKIRFENTFRTIYLLPMSLSFVVTAVFWRWMYNPQSGVINLVLNAVLTTLGLDPISTNWLGGSISTGILGAIPLVPDVLYYRLFAIMFALTWQFSGYAMVVYLAGLRAIPDDHYEAARVDGASTLRMYQRVIVPQLRSSTISAAVVLMVFALKAFDFLYVLFGSNPGPFGDILSTMMYREAFSANNWAYGATIGLILFAMALTVIGPYLYSEYRRGEL
ncbi:carbohydrate ABC transporter permease [Halospeciosus flavus]|uniref:Carbohydrate ABC transporter permease n=1 Tax=Halospeciosus flavus TaxID=3032283 RepID=A0ABD5Z0D1_9EURY|nr:sugar ABC transporter permease [Halospeciosus flavus]